MSDEGRLVAGRYRLVERIGSGAMGVVWRAVDDRLNRVVAVKKLLLQPGLPPDEAEEAVARCMREGRIAARLHHPNAIAVFDVVDEDGAPILIMEYLPSVSLAGALSERGALPVAEVARIGSHVAAALAAAHAAGIVHRDIKPGNILLGHDGTVKITDFGISRATDDVTVTKTGLIAGTPAYLAPEVAIGRDPSAASDVYSLGSTLYAAVEGQPPFGLSENTLGLLHAVASGKINPPTRSGPLTGVLTALLAGDPVDRPSAAKARDLLASVARGDVPELPLPGGRMPESYADSYVDDVDGYPDDYDDYDDGGATRVVAPGTVARAEPARSTNNRSLVFAGVGVAAVLAIGAWLVLAQKGGGTGTEPTPVNNQPQHSVVVTTEAPEESPVGGKPTKGKHSTSTSSEAPSSAPSSEAPPSSEDKPSTTTTPSSKPSPSNPKPTDVDPSPPPTDPSDGVATPVKPPVGGP